MHLHTHRSFDCRNRPGAILEVARARGLDRIVVTDHNEIAGAWELAALDPERVIVGEEVKTREGFDVIGIFMRDLIPRGTPARETCERIREQGGVVYLPHPFDGSRSGGPALLAALADLVDVVEVHNARCFPRSLNTRARAWAEAMGKRSGAGSDAHTIAEIGRGFVEVPPFENERESFLVALEQGRIGGTNTSPIYRLASIYAKLRNAAIGSRS
ncbi:MAG TPA: PHP domain-containing protein [Longimicrobiaceae bacterium]|nr:PHP domain-containing protein [Longimicrobiaceae bacterium]